ncbi:hypothetical protein K432DRAFT_101134 [Lepidopterella palustris CBS 459.81]|uniref:Uncharacterized protein n=1 Tax=Lepidopterella palustris CBS 459.81 TaxID=1314670 RepID=A0A8E2E6I0_9PEZI|nr:hypothetical protein K432DRAFT_101134 [Lepidopterella palustris CBS 459.81]
MFFSKPAILLLAFATGFASEAVARPQPYGSGLSLAVRRPNAAPALPAPEVFPPLKRAAKGSEKNNGNKDVIEITEVDLTVIEEKNKEVIIEQVKEVLIVNSSNNSKNNKKRKAAYKSKSKDVTTVLIVVQIIEIKIDDGKGNKIQEDIFAESIVIANKGKKSTQTIMITDISKLVAGTTRGDATGTAAATAAAAVTDPAALNSSNATQSVTLAGVAPSWTSIDPDPIASALSLVAALEN